MIQVPEHPVCKKMHSVLRNHFSVFGKSLHTLSSKEISSQKVQKDIGVMRVYILSVLRSAGVM